MRGFAARGGLVGVVTVLSGCGVLEIDVDVYKGPLVNEKDVQLSQMAIMAVAAKPLLIGLRDRFEFWPSEEDYRRVPAPNCTHGPATNCGCRVRSAEEKRRMFEEGIRAAREKGWYRDGFIRYPDWLRLEKEHSRQINALLGSYEDISGAEIAGLINEFRTRLRRYLTAYEVINAPTDKRLIDAFERRVDVEGIAKRHPALKEVPAIKDIARELAAAYRHFLSVGRYTDPSSSKTFQIAEPHNALVRLCGDRDELAAAYPLGREMDAKSANDRFDALTNVHVVRTHLRLILREDVQDEAAMVGHVVNVSTAFLDARKHLSEAFEFLAYLLEMLWSESTSVRGDDRPVARQAVAKLIALIVRPRQLAFALKCSPPPGLGDELAPFLREFQQEVEASTGGPLAELKKLKLAELRDRLADFDEARLEDEREQAARLALERALLQGRPELRGPHFVHALLECHLWFSGTWKSRPEARFGLVRGPTPTDLAAIEDAAASIDEVSRLAVGAGLDRGRLPQGLETLIETFLAVCDRPNAAKTREESRDRLLNALVRFSQVLLFMANNVKLINPGLLDRAWDRDQTLENYVATLQAVGNSIMIQVDELRHREAAERRATACAELAALRSTRARTPGEVVGAIASALAAEGERLASAKPPGESAQAHKDAAKAVLEIQSEVLKRAAAAGDAWTPQVVFASVCEIFQQRAEKAAKEHQEFEAGVKTIHASPEPGKYAAVEGAATAAEAREILAGLIADEKVKAVLEAVKDAVAKRAEKGTRKEAWARVLEEVEKRRAALEKASKTAAQQRDIVKALPTPGLAMPDPNCEAKSAKDVLDGVIAGLRYEHIEAMKLGKERADAVKRAIDLALEYRSGMVYIRPPSVYLRSSFPAPTLQRDSAGAWRNLVGRHFGRAATWGNAWTDGDHRQQLELDKQFWQSVNRVRVAGGGDVNYVVAKDDIGNWYVKNYSSDPKRIINSMKNLALFGAGAGLGRSLAVTDAAGKLLAAQAAGPREETKGALESKFQKERDAFENSAKEQNAAFRKDIETVKDDFAKSHAGFAGAVADAHAAFVKEADALAEDKKLADSARSVDLLRAARRYARDGRAAIGTGEPTDDRTKAQSEFSRLMRTRMQKFLQQRREEVGRHESLISLLGELAED